MDKNTENKIRNLHKKIREKKATKCEKDEYMRILHQEGLVTDEQYDRYCNGNDKDWLISLAKLAGAAFIVWGLNKES